MESACQSEVWSLNNETSILDLIKSQERVHPQKQTILGEDWSSLVEYLERALDTLVASVLFYEGKWRVDVTLKALEGESSCESIRVGRSTSRGAEKRATST